MRFGKSLLVQVIGGIFTLFIASIATIIYETYIKSPTGNIEMSFFQMLLSIIGLFILLMLLSGVPWHGKADHLSINHNRYILPFLNMPHIQNN